MRVLTGFVGILALAQSGFCAQPQQPIPAGQLVREVVFNELNDHQGHGYWRYWVEHHTPKETRIDEQVETAQGPVTRLTLSNGLPPSPQAEAEDLARLQRLLNSPDEQAKHLHEYEENENRIGRILALLPDAFLYDYDGEENGCHRLRFRPNPDYPPHSIEARVFHSMSGTLWIDARYKHLSRLEGRIQENLDFGYGILGRLYKGGWFQLERTQVSPSDWKTVRLEVHMSGRALLVKSFARNTSEARGGFAPVPPGMNLAQGMALLQQIEARNQPQPLSPRALAASTAFAPRR
ncbi:MAG: hypothetical protein ABSF16_15210 [Terracidiphilus sp.]|jgi:hypothetical protein